MEMYIFGWKTVLDGLECGPRPNAILKTKGTVFFFHADQFRPLNNLFNFFAGLFLPLCREWREKFRKKLDRLRVRD